MSKKYLVDDITEILDSLIRRQELIKGTKYGDKYESWEDFGLHILNLIYGWKLEDLNLKFNRDFPAIDLGDENNQIGVQVTIDNSTKHINSTIKTYENGFEINGGNILPNKYVNLKFLFISTTHLITKKYNHKFKNDGFNFNNTDIITFNTLLKYIEIKSKDELEEIKKKLKEYIYEGEYNTFFSEKLRANEYELAKKVLKDNLANFKKDIAFKNVVEEISNSEIKKNNYEIVENVQKDFSNDGTFKNIVEEISNVQNKVTGKDNVFTYDFEKFSETYSFILKNIERLSKKDLTLSEELKFYKNISNSDSYIFHFFENLGKIKEDLLITIIDKLVINIIQNTPKYQNLLSIIIYLEQYINSTKTNIILEIYLKVLLVANDEFIFRKIAIILSQNKFKKTSKDILLESIKSIVKKGKRISHDFIVEFLSKNIDIFDKNQVKELMSLFNFSGEDNENLIFIGEDLRGEKYFPEIISKILIIDYKLTFHLFGDLLKLFNERDKYSKVLKSIKLKEVNGIKYIGYYGFPEVNLQVKRSRNNLESNIFVAIGKELIKLGSSKTDRRLFDEIVCYLIENSNYSVFYELISFVLIEQQKENIKLIEKLVKKKEILPFINVFQERWGIKIYNYYLNQNSNYIEEFEKNIFEEKEFNKDVSFHKAYLLKTIPEIKISEEGKKFIKDFEDTNKHKMIFRNKPAIEVKTSFGRPDPLVIKLLEKETEEDLHLKIDKIIEKEKGWDFYDYKSIFTNYFGSNLTQIKNNYLYIADKGEDYYILSSLVINGFVDYSKEKYKDSINIEFYKELIDIYSVIKEDDTYSKLEIGRLLDENGFIRSEFTKDIRSIDEDVFSGIKEIVLNIASNKEPQKEDGDNDGLMLGLNTVRGIGTIICSVLFHYYPLDKELKKKIEELSNDYLYGIQATLISNFNLFVNDNFDLVGSILSKYIYNRNKVIDYSIVNYFIGRLGFLEHKELFLQLLNGLLESEDNDIQDKVGQLLGNVILSAINTDKYHEIKEYIEVLDDIINNKKGTQKTIIGFCYTFENNIISANSIILNIKLDLFSGILNTYNIVQHKEEYMTIYYRLSFLFYDEVTPIEYFDILYDRNIFKLLIEKSKSNKVYGNINKYLYRVLEQDGDKVLYKVLNILDLEVNNNIKIFDIHSFNGLDKIIKFIYENYNGKDNEVCNRIFEKGLERGNKEYKEIYKKYY